MTAEIIADYLAGMPLRKIAEKYYVSPCYIYSHTELRRGRMNLKVNKAEAVDLYLRGLSINAVARELDTSHSYIKTILKAAGVRIRTGRPKGEMK